MTYAKIIKKIARKEGLKESISIAQIREVVGILTDLIFQNPIVICAELFRIGKQRFNKK